MQLDRARRALNQCQQCFHQAESQFAEELVAYERLRGIEQMAAKRGQEWMAWAGSVKYGLEQCKVPISGAGRTLAACWQELAERSHSTSIVIHSENHGQKVNLSEGAHPHAVPTEAI